MRSEKPCTGESEEERMMMMTMMMMTMRRRKRRRRRRRMRRRRRRRRRRSKKIIVMRLYELLFVLTFMKASICFLTLSVNRHFTTKLAGREGKEVILH